MGRKPVQEIRDQRFPRSLVGALCAVAIFVGAAPVAFAEIVERTVANINGEIILLSDLRQRIEMRQKFGGDGAKGYGEEEALQDLIEEKVLARYAEENDVVIKESEVDTSIQNLLDRNQLQMEQFKEYLKLQGTTMEKYREQMKNQMLIQRITGMEVKTPSISDDEARAYYEAHKGEFADPGRVRASHIVLLASRDRDPNAFGEAWDKMVELKKKIDQGGDFAAMAKRYSQDASSEQGGDLGWFGAGKMIPEFERIAFALKPGEVGGPVETRFGVHLIKVIDREAPSAQSFDLVLESIREKLAESLYKERRQAWVDKIRDQAYIEILR